LRLSKLPDLIKKNFFIVLLFSLLNWTSYAQENSKSVKKIESLLSEAGDAFVDLEVDKSLNLTKQALNDAHAINDNVLMAKCYNLIGLNFEEFYDVKKSIGYYNKALHHANLTKNDSIKCWVNNNLGNVYSYRENNFNKSIEYYKKGLAYAKKINDSIEIMYTNLSICGAYFAEEDFTNGIQFLQTSKDFIDKSDLVEAKITQSTLYGSYYSYLNQNQKAEQYYLTAIKYGTLNKDNLYESYLCDVYQDFSNFYKKNRNFEKALYYLDLHEQLVKKIYNDDRAKKAKLSGNSIEFDEYERKIDEFEEEIDVQYASLRQSKVITGLFLILLLTLGLLTYNYYKNSKLREKLNKKLVQANQELLIAKENAEEASRLKTQFVSTISHELRTPLYGVVGITNIILDEHKELEKSPHLNSLKFSARYLLSLVNDLLQINKIEENRVSLENMIFNMSDEINTIADSLEFIAIKNNNTISTEIDTDIPEYLIGDKLRLSQVVLNLLSNALKFTKDGEVKVIVNQERVEGNRYFINFKVQDTGVGIAKEDQDKIFDKFVQIERKEGDYQGTGLGLSIVKKLVEVFDSSIAIESELGEGTTFSFTIGFLVDESKRTEIINNFEVDLSTSNLYKILVVEDNKINQVVTRKILQNSNFECRVVDDGYTAIDFLEKEKFDLILMDINMPIINGFETTKLIRKKGNTIPIIALTAFDKQEVSEEALSCGMNDVIIKPFDSAKLITVINSCIQNENAG
jgi:signal transduction histidine kinase/CheY-like chemotaxis protein